MLPVKFNPRFTLVILMMLILVGCSTNGANPLKPPIYPATPNQTPDASISGNGSHRVLWGIWGIRFEPDQMKLTLVPERDIQLHYDITTMLIPPACDNCLEIAVKSFDSLTRILDADVTLRNPYPIAGHDVRGILFTNDAGHELCNADDWTGYWDIPGGSNINPFKAFAKQEPARIFAGGAEHVEKYLLSIPTPPQWGAIKFAVDASWPGNCKEPYSIENFTQLIPLYNVVDSSSTLEVDVQDWQNDVSKVTLVATAITGESFTQFAHIGGSLWRLKLVNKTGAPAGDYEARLIATSTNSGSTALYDFATITIMESLTPTVTAIIPEGGCAGSNLTGVKVIGADFQEPAGVKLKRMAEPDISASDVVVVSEGLITCDINIPPGAGLGVYDVEVTNGCGLSGIGGCLFNIVEQGPFYPYEITPPRLNLSPEAICFSGNYAFLAAGYNGVHIFDAANPSNPIWVTKIETDGCAKNIVVAGNFAYVAALEDGLQIIDISNPHAPFVVNTIPTQYALDVAIAGGYAYVANMEKGFSIIDVDPPESAYIVKTIDVTPWIEVYAVDVVGDYAYVAGYDFNLIFDINPPADTHVVKEIATTGWFQDVDEENGYAYFCDTDAGLQVLDVDPINDSYVVTTVPIEEPSGLVVSGGYAYVAAYSVGLVIVDVNIPESPVIAKIVPWDGNSINLGITGGYAYVSDRDAGLKIIDIDPPSTANIVKEIETPGFACDVFEDAAYVYVANNTAGLCVVDANPPDTAFVVKTIDTKAANALEVAGGYAYLSGWYGSLDIIDITPLESAYVLKTVTLPGAVHSLSVEGGYAYALKANPAAFYIVDIDPPESANVIKTLDVTGFAYGIEATDSGFVYIPNGEAGLKVYDVDPPGSSVEVDSVDTPDTARGVYVDASRTYIADGGGGLQVIDGLPGSGMTIIKGVDTPGNAYDVVADGGYAYVADFENGLQIIDIDPIGSASIIATVDTPQCAVRVFVSGNIAYVADLHGGLRIIKLW